MLSSTPDNSVIGLLRHETLKIVEFVVIHFDRMQDGRYLIYVSNADTGLQIKRHRPRLISAELVRKLEMKAKPFDSVSRFKAFASLYQR